MSNEITINATVRVENGNLKYDFIPGQLQADQTTARRGGHIQTIGTASAEVLSFGDVSSPSLCILRNIDSTNFVTVGPQNGTTSDMEPTLKLAAGRFAVLWLDPSVTLMAQADTAAVDLQVDVFEA